MLVNFEPYNTPKPVMPEDTPKGSNNQKVTDVQSAAFKALNYLNYKIGNHE